MIKIRYLLLFLAFIALWPATAQEKAMHEPLPLFRSDSMLLLELKADFDQIFSVTDDSTYFPAVMTLKDDKGQTRSFEIEARTRGNTRRQEDICHFPPLRLRFPKKGMEGTPFEGQRAIKLVTHCSRAGQFEQNTVIEYLIYRAFNILTDTSLKVRPVMFSYIDSEKNSDTLQRFAFFIEREKHLAERLGGSEWEAEKIHPEDVDLFQSNLVDIFEYMIGNTDYSIYELHNIVMFSDTAGEAPAVPVPYDFDWSGLVAAHYAVPHPLMGTESVTERVYRGLRQDPAVVSRTVTLFRSKEDEILGLFQGFELLDEKERKFTERYLGDFFKMLEKERSVENEFINNAREMED